MQDPSMANVCQAWILHANRHPKATHQWPWGAFGCRIQAWQTFARLKRLKPLKRVKRLKTLTTRHGGPSLPFAMLHGCSQQAPQGLDTHQWLLMGVQACRLPALKPLKPLPVMGVQACRLPCFILQPTNGHTSRLDSGLKKGTQIYPAQDQKQRNHHDMQGSLGCLLAAG